MRYWRLDAPRHSYVPASPGWTLVIFKERPINLNFPPDSIFSSFLTRYHATFWPGSGTSSEHVTVSVLSWSEACCLFSSVCLPFVSEKNVVNQICYRSNIMKERTNFRVDHRDITKNLSCILETYIKTTHRLKQKFGFIKLVDKGWITTVKD